MKQSPPKSLRKPFGMRNIIFCCALFFLLWLPTHAFGSSWQIYNTLAGLPGNNVTCFAVTAKKMAVGTDKGVALYDGDLCQWQKIDLPEQLSTAYIHDMAFDENGNLWLATSGGVVHVSIQSGLSPTNSVDIMGMADGLPTVDIERLQIRNQEIFVGTFGGYVLKAVTPPTGRTTFSPLNFSSSFSADQGMRIKSIGITGLAMRDSSQGWISTKGAGIVLSQGSSQMILDSSQGLKSDWVESFWKFDGPQNSEHLLVGSTEGIDLLKDWKPVGFVRVPTNSPQNWVTSLTAYFNEDNPKPRKGENDTGCDLKKMYYF